MAARIATPEQICELVDQFTYARGNLFQQGRVTVGPADFLGFLGEYFIRHPTIILNASGTQLRGVFNSLANLARETKTPEVAVIIRKIADLVARGVNDEIRAAVEEALGALELCSSDVARAARDGIDRIESRSFSPVRVTGYNPALLRI